MKILVTGATGFVGGHLTALLKHGDDEVYGTTFEDTDDPYLRQLDLTDSESVDGLIAEIRPDVVYHLAAFASTAMSFKQPVLAIGSTVAIQVNLYEACLKVELSPRILVVSSGQLYGSVEGSALPIKETHKLDMASPYAVAKVGQENLVEYYEKRGFESVLARPFNHVGPGQQPGFLVPDLAKQIAELELESGEAVMKVGNLTPKRDFTDVRDVVRAYQLLAEKGKASEVYNVCTGRSIAGQKILDTLLAQSKKKIRTVEDPERMRPADIMDLYGDAGKLRKQTGWEPEIRIEQTLEDTLKYWRGRVAKV
jgi:GDP-4-dehydro-6-deoxy-D-mannose reductase